MRDSGRSVSSLVRLSYLIIIMVELLSSLHGKCEKLATNISRNSAITRSYNAKKLSQSKLERRESYLKLKN